MKSTNLPIFQVDAFTDIPFKGNPAAVVLLEQDADPAWMQNIAREMNLSEMAFVSPRGDDFHLRWFTPAAEVELCGHATLASAHTLWESGRIPVDKNIRFFTLSGWLSATKKQDLVELDFPAAGTIPGEITEEVVHTVGLIPDFAGVSGDKWLFEYSHEKEVRNLKPDFEALKKMKGRGLIVTSRSETPDFDFISRYFAPWIGINEDPVTGSAHTILGPYWRQKLHKDYLTAYQASERGGVIYLHVSADRVYISGKAVTIFAGELKCLEN